MKDKHHHDMAHKILRSSLAAKQQIEEKAVKLFPLESNTEFAKIPGEEKLGTLLALGTSTHQGKRILHAIDTIDTTFDANIKYDRDSENKRIAANKTREAVANKLSESDNADKIVYDFKLLMNKFPPSQMQER